MRLLAAALPSDFAAPVLLTLHIGAHRSFLPEILAHAGPLPAATAVHGEAIEGGRIYVAPPDQHLLVSDERVYLSRGSKQHHTRPAVDPLFVSAALARRSATIGVLLTGRLDDGTAGLQAIKACGGTAVVQDPDDAEEPDMPASALRHVAVDHCVPLAELAPLLVALSTRPVSVAPSDPAPERLVHEQAVVLAKGDAMAHMVHFAEPSSFACPDCHGALWEVRDAQPRRFRCHTGHGFTLRTLQDTLAGASDEALWNARRALQERLFLLREMQPEAMPRPKPPAYAVESAARQVERQLVALEGLMAHGPDPVE
jgi:two-component system, chemotaxis family, protein-glutamate methylesterase/glutaminase